MKKLISIFTLLFVCSISVFAGPFGLDMGMTIEDVTKACGGNELEYISDDRYYIQPVKSHPLFEGYVVWISETEATYITSKAYIWIEYGFANAVDGFDNLDDVL